MAWDWIGKLEELRRGDTPVAIVTVTQVQGSAPRETGAKMLVLEDGTFFGTIGGGNLESQATREARDCLRSGTSRVSRYPLGAKVGQCCGGVVDLLIESVNVGPRLYLFGAGHVGQALSRVLDGTAFRVHVVDERDEWLLSPRLPDSVVRHHEDWEDVVERAAWDERTYAAVMTHRHDLDEEIIAALVRKPARFIGLIGSDAKWTRFRQRLANRGYSEAELSRVKCPIGIATLGKAPQEVAISFAAELLSLAAQAAH